MFDAHTYKDVLKINSKVDSGSDVLKFNFAKSQVRKLTSETFVGPGKIVHWDDNRNTMPQNGTLHLRR